MCKTESKISLFSHKHYQPKVCFINPSSVGILASMLFLSFVNIKILQVNIFQKYPNDFKILLSLFLCCFSLSLVSCSSALFRSVTLSVPLWLVCWIHTIRIYSFKMVNNPLSSSFPQISPSPLSLSLFLGYSVWPKIVDVLPRNPCKS